MAEDGSVDFGACSAACARGIARRGGCCSRGRVSGCAAFEMHCFLNPAPAEIARVPGLHPRKVSYFRVAVTQRLGEGLDAVL